MGTLPLAEGAFNHVLLRSAQLERILSSLEHANARIWIVDRYQRVRAQVGSLQVYGLEEHGLETEQRGETSVQQALQGSPALQRRPIPEGRGEIIMATHPVRIGDQVLGAVVVEQSTADILALQRRTLERIGLITVTVLFIIISGLMLFASRLALRIRRLSRETHEAIAADGRVQHTRLHSERQAGDELGDLSRTISGLLERLARYTRFLEHMPRMLRHELHNPLNVISTSLQNLAPQQDANEQQRYRDSAQRGVARISAIVQTLTEAASLEEALRHEEREAVELHSLLSHYTESCRLQHPQRRFELQTEGAPLRVLANDFRIEQLLDKLVGNAVDFSPAGSCIHLQLGREAGGIIGLAVRNEGQPLPEEIRERLFDSLVSRRETASDNTHHLGMGLYVVRLIAEHAGGRVRAENVQAPEGVAIRVWLPEWTGSVD
jgi:signal transduction histidine kinase